MLLGFPVCVSCYLTLSRWTNQQFRNIAFSHCARVYVCICVSEVPITVLVLKMEPENEYTTSSSSLKFEETMTVDQSQKTSNSQDTWSESRNLSCFNRLWTLNGKIYCHFTADTFLHSWRNTFYLPTMVQHRQWIIYLT